MHPLPGASARNEGAMLRIVYILKRYGCRQQRACIVGSARMPVAPSTSARALFGRRLRVLRAERGISQEELARAAGLHRTYVSSVERGERNVSFDNICALARAFGLPAAELFRDVDEASRQQ